MNGKKVLPVRRLTLISLMIAITFVLALTPIGMIRLPIVSITIAHVPAIVTAITIGLLDGVIVSLSFGILSLYLAITSPTSILDPFFVNPLISILPRLLIPIVAYFVYKGLLILFAKARGGVQIATVTAIVFGNLTNTFGVYTMLYLVYAREIAEKAGKPAIELIIGAVSLTTLWKTIGIVIIASPVIYAINRVYKKT